LDRGEVDPLIVATAAGIARLIVAAAPTGLLRRADRASGALPFLVVGTAGTVTSLAAMAQKLPAYEPARIHNYELQLSTIQELEQAFLSRKKADRAGLPGLEKGREEVIAAGAIIIRTVMETLGMPRVLVSDLGLREGVLLNLASRAEPQ